MKFDNVSIASLKHVDAPHRITSAELDEQLKSTMERLDIRPGLLEKLAGITARRFWSPGVQPSEVASEAAEFAIEEAGIDRDRLGALINTSVCRDYIEPSTACLVHGNLGLDEHCLNFDIGNACLAFLNGMDVAARMIERLEVIHYAVSLGHIRSLVYWIPTDMVMASTFRLAPVAERKYRDFAGDGVFRFSIGIEDPEDLIDDLERVLG